MSTTDGSTEVIEYVPGERIVEIPSVTKEISNWIREIYRGYFGKNTRRNLPREHPERVAARNNTISYLAGLVDHIHLAEQEAVGSIEGIDKTIRRLKVRKKLAPAAQPKHRRVNKKFNRRPL